MYQFVKRVVQKFTQPSPARPAPRKRACYRPSIEGLENREMLSVSPLSADADRSLTTPTASLWYYNVDANFLTAQVQQNNARIIDLRVESSSPLRFDATLVRNQGDYGKGWWWYYGQTGDQLAAKVGSLNARITDLESYTVNGQRQFAALLTPNTGAQAKSWWWYYNMSPAAVSQQLVNHQARLVDIGREANGNLDVVMVANKGVDARSWWWYQGVDPSTVAYRLSQNGARLTDLERQPNGTFDVIMERNQGDGFWWYFGQTAQQLADTAGRNGARIVQEERYIENGQSRFAALMVNNSNALTTSAGDLLRQSSDVANVGLYLKQVGGPVLANLQGERQFEPASMLKVLIYVHALRQVQAGGARLTDTITYFVDPANPTNPNSNPDAIAHTQANSRTTTLQNALQQMMQVSDNRMTMAVLDRFGRAAVNATARALGLNQTVIGATNSFGSGAAGNLFTLEDAGRLYEAVANGTALNAATRTTFNNLMLNGIDGALQDVVRQEAARRLGLSTGAVAVAALTSQFLAQMQQVQKGGGYTLSQDATHWREIRTVGGWVSLPFKQRGIITRIGFVYGQFVENAISDRSSPNVSQSRINNALASSEAELFRGQIRAALATW